MINAKKNKIVLFMLLISVVVVSGCSIPFFGDGGQVTSQYENDIVIIKDQSVYPQAVKSNQKITLVTYIQNLAERNPDDFKVTVDLYDTCGVFKENGVEPKCPKSDQVEGTKCKDVELLPKEVKEISWTLDPDTQKVKVPISSCKLKVAVSYPYKTVSQTEVYFINSAESRRQQEQGTFREKSSVPQKGEGPIAAFIVPDSNVRQPIPDDAGSFPVSLYIENKGAGFLASDYTIKGDGIEIKVDNTVLAEAGVDKENCVFLKDTSVWNGKELKLIGKKSPPYPCPFNVPKDVSREKTSRIEVSFKQPYTYEFRKESSVTIEPS